MTARVDLVLMAQGVPMTARYRCPFCGSFTGNGPEVRSHLIRRHRAALIQRLDYIENFGTRDKENAP